MLVCKTNIAKTDLRLQMIISWELTFGMVSATDFKAAYTFELNLAAESPLFLYLAEHQ